MLFLSADSSFSLITNYLSDLGSGPNGSSFVFNIGMIITSFIMILFYIHLSLILYQKGAYKFLIIISFLLGVLSACGIFFIGVFPINFSQELHNHSANYFFLGGLGTTFFFTIAEITTPKFSKVQVFSGIVVIMTFLIFIIINALNYFNPGQFETESRIIEWSIFFILILWLIEHAIIVFKQKKVMGSIVS